MLTKMTLVLLFGAGLAVAAIGTSPAIDTSGDNCCERNLACCDVGGACCGSEALGSDCCDAGLDCCDAGLECCDAGLDCCDAGECCQPWSCCDTEAGSEH